MSGERVLQGHGTGNDFVLLPDPDGTVWPADRLDDALVRRLCDRRAGLGGDGVLRLVRSRHVPDAAGVLGADLDAGEWFMDHRNADGSYAEMCGNGIRLYLHALLAEGLLDPAAAAAGVAVGTRGGLRRVGSAPGGGYRVDMGPARPFGHGSATIGGARFTGTAVSMGNPHLVCLTDVPVSGLDLTGTPAVDAGLFPEGVNVELVNVLPGGDPHARMRVVERGVGETRSCGTGACAAAHTVLAAAGRDAGTVTVDVPGGRLTVDVDPGGTVLGGPAVLVAEGTLTAEWLAG
ncbi:diaminopimelate epimerase [Modestobacter sp. I12A-02628]|uniref:Diaminopimelate epimerase n=1 Tax=Goekera deserti TaxID=2497753 RepID=A0A7K3WJU2_9ACTN|nr:diaminopimelate epimerase [Goekera deserti]MPQ96369.1 diaminopimelate epimerase [Goekera deserti]NDI50537.1 diaminopimelate epimerase [Goekera deserti]NEL56149.1 diaminopimelate epimerase [Goekera deserti]